MIQSLKDRVKRYVGDRLLRENIRVLQEQDLLLNERLDPALWDCSVDEDGAMLMDGASLPAVARQWGTPLHVVSIERLHRNATDFLGAFADVHATVRLGTSYKTNPVPYVLRRLHDIGTLAEVISEFELWLALDLGMPGERIVFNGPAKTTSSLQTAVQNGVWLINVDSLEELEELERVCASLGRRQRVGVRVTTGVGWGSQFGLPVADGSALRAFSRASGSEWLEPVGVHLHLGTGIRSVDTYVQGIREVLDLARRVLADTGTTLSVLDLGGGFGVSTTTTKTEWDHRLQHQGRPVRKAVPTTAPTPQDYARPIVPMVNRYFEDVGLGREEGHLIFEPGRAITASSQTLLLSVIRVKREGRSVPDVILDGGHNLCVPLAWEFHEIHPAGKMSDGTLVVQNLVGPLCHPHDIVSKYAALPELDEGDVVAVMDAGAYFISSQTNFSNPRPGVVAIEQGHPRLVRAPETHADIVRLDLREAHDADV